VGNGYQLRVTTESLDVLRFRATIAQAEQLDPAHRQEVFSRYLAALSIAPAPAGDDLLRTLPVFLGLEDERVRALVMAAEYAASPDEYAALLPPCERRRATCSGRVAARGAHDRAVRDRPAVGGAGALPYGSDRATGGTRNLAERRARGAQTIALGGERPSAGRARPRP